jgi:ssDNA-binding Zn-finger/Zn-ribbon topoisomerase 1
MERFLVCNNPKCHFVLDRHINGKDGAHLIVKKCPACGGAWSSTCPACTHQLAVKLVGGLPHSVCCERKPATNARAA